MAREMTARQLIDGNIKILERRLKEVTITGNTQDIEFLTNTIARIKDKLKNLHE